MNIAIIGAGLSGLLTARGLMSLGFNVTVFEKSQGSGGRMSTKRMDWGTADMGAQYFTAVDPHFKKMVESWQKRGWCSKWNFTPFRQKNGCIEASADNTQRFTGIGGMSQITRGLVNSVNTLFGTSIERVERVSQGWHLYGTDAQSLGVFKWLVCTQPAEQTFDLINDHCALASYLPSQIHQPSWAFACATSGHGRIDVDGVFADGELSWVSRQSSKPGCLTRPQDNSVWVMHFNSCWSKAVGNQIDQTELFQIAQQWLQAYIGKDLLITHSTSHFWRYARTKERSQTTPALIDSELNLACVGAWAAGDNVEGAFLSSRYLLDHFDSVV